MKTTSEHGFFLGDLPGLSHTDGLGFASFLLELCKYIFIYTHI